MTKAKKSESDGDGGNVTSMDLAREAVAEGVEKARSAVSQRVGTARERMRDSKLSERVKKASGRAGEAAREGYGVAKEKLGTGYERARKDLDQLVGDVNVYVRDNPGRAVLIAAGVGFVLGFLLRRDRRA
ncbi:MAG: hypothetical protein OXG74_14125 [Acidobacteria bacterium]|nr:hypothetical protein [Acidobacteriota bacterium]